MFGEERSAFDIPSCIRYLSEIRQLARELGWSAQETDLAVWEYAADTEEMDDKPDTSNTISGTTLHSGHDSPDGAGRHAEDFGAFGLTLPPMQEGFKPG